MRNTPGRRRTRLIAFIGAGAVLAPLTIGAPTWAAPELSVAEDGSYIVMMKQESVAAYDGGLQGIQATKPAEGEKLDTTSVAARSYVDLLRSEHNEVLASIGLEAETKTYDYTTVFNGFAVDLTAQQVTAVRKNPDVAYVWEDELRFADTVSTPDYLGLRGEGGVWDTEFNGPADAGEGIVVGVIDTGIWPENPSFADLPGNPAPPASWNGECIEGDDDPEGNITCNSKLIGARYYPQGNTTEFDFLSPRDTNSHGSHTAGTAAGNNGVDIEVLGTEMGTGSGMAPAAQIAAYKALWQTSDGNSGAISGLLAAVNDAVDDGVDVINYSVNGSSQSVVDPIELAFFDAAAANVFVAASAGNSGATVGAGSVAHNPPWVMTVAASTHDRNVSKYLELGDDVRHQGVGVGAAVGSADLIDSEDYPAADSTAEEAQLCLPGSLDEDAIEGEIVICTRGQNARTEKSQVVADAGGVGMILVNTNDRQSLNADVHVIPSIHVNGTAGAAIKASEESAENPTAFIPATGEGDAEMVVPEMAGFSSYGPAIPGNGDLLKPDITAPGVDVIAAVSPLTYDGSDFNSFSGTSMSAPHVAGLAALMMSKETGWTPMAVKSALMTTADPLNSDGEPIYYGGAPANPLHYGSGEIEPAASYGTPLVYESDWQDWYDYACAIGQLQLVGGSAYCDANPYVDPSDLNYPSIAVGALGGAQTVTRTVTATDEGGTFTAAVEAPAGMTVEVSPATITVPAGGEATFEVTITNVTAELDEWGFGSITWTGPGSDVRSPIAVKPVAVSAPAELVVSSGTDIVDRIAGKDRYATAAEIAMEYPADVDTVYIATGNQFADALAGAAPAAKGLVPTGAEGSGTEQVAVAPDGSPAPVLLTRVGSLPSATEAALEAIDPANIVVLGGEAAVSAAVEAELDGYGIVSRVAGKDRYHTAALLAAQYGEVDHVYVATGEGNNFPDALSGGALAGFEGVPVLLVRGDSVPDSVTQALTQLGDPEVTILGGEVVVSGDVADELGTTDRLAGKNRYRTSVAVAERFGYSQENPADAAYVATGEDYPDALAGSALAGGQDVPVMLSRQASVPSGVLSAMVGTSPAAVHILGGEVALSEAVEAQLEESFTTEGSTTFEVVPGSTGTMTSVIHGLVAADSQEVSVTSDGPAGGAGIADEIVEITVPAGTAALRVEVWQDEWTPSEDLDLDLYLADSTGTIIAQTAAAGSDESITVNAPAPGTYLVAIDNWDAPAGDLATGPLHLYLPDEDEGNLDVTPSPVATVTGVPVELTAAWSGLEAATRYLGVIGYDFGSGEVGHTLVAFLP